jgi:hypothetical protein
MWRPVGGCPTGTSVPAGRLSEPIRQYKDKGRDPVGFRCLQAGAAQYLIRMPKFAACSQKSSWTNSRVRPGTRPRTP